MIKKLLDPNLIEQKYYILGLALQKGIPFLSIPLITYFFGTAVYSDYILIFGIVQFIALFLGMGITGAVIVFWHQNTNKNQYWSKLFFVNLILHLVIGLIAYPFINDYLKNKLFFSNSAALTLLILVYAFAYNLNNMGISTLRAQLLSKSFFIIVTTGGMLLLLLISALPQFLHANLALLLLLFMSISLIQSLLSIGKSRIKLQISGAFNNFRSFFMEIFSFSFPVMLYILLTLSLTTLDKIIVKSSFSEKFFITYSYDYQFSSAIWLISAAINMYSVPQFCKQLAEGKISEIRKTLKANYRLTFIFSILLSIAAFCYAYLTGIALDKGYWLFSLAFLFANLFTLNVSLMEAYKNSKKLFTIVLLPTAVFWVLFITSSWIGEEWFLYMLFIFYYCFLTWSSRRFINKKLAGHHY